MTIIVNVSDHFEEVSGITRADSSNSAEALLSDILEPHLLRLSDTERLVIVLDDPKDAYALQYSSAYLRAAFVGLLDKMGYENFIHKVAFECHHKDNEFYIKKIMEYCKEK